MSQGTQEPFARVNGRLGGFAIGKRLDVNTQKGLLGIVAAILLANAVKKAKDPKKSRLAKAKDITPKVDVGSFLSQLLK
jgi:hypothetical protein